MLKDNLIMLRSTHGYSQEELAEKIGISRQAYAKWERGATVPDIEKCKLLADVYGKHRQSGKNGKDRGLRNAASSTFPAAGIKENFVSSYEKK